jgi:hypothetical protein
MSGINRLSFSLHPDHWLGSHVDGVNRGGGVAEICVTKGLTGNASETLVVEPTVDERPVAVDGRTVANDNDNDAVVEIEGKPDPRAGDGVGGSDVIDDIIVHELWRDQTWTGDESSSELFVKSMMSFSGFIISKIMNSTVPRQARVCEGEKMTRKGVMDKPLNEAYYSSPSDRYAELRLAFSSLLTLRRLMLPTRLLRSE